MTKKIYKLFTPEIKAIDPEAGIYEAMISTEDVDRDGDIMKATGASISDYMKNPVVLFGHNYRDATAVVGKALSIEKIDGQGIKARWQFADKETSEDADLVRRLWAGGFLNATSIGFIPEEWEKRETDEGEELERGRVYTEWELLEFSIVPVPANQSALRLAVKTLVDWQTNAINYLGTEWEPQEYNEGEPAPDIDDPDPDPEDEPNTDDPPHDESEDLTDQELGELQEQYDELLEVLP